MTPTATTYEATIEGWHPVNVANVRLHWATRHRAVKAEKLLAFLAAKEARWQPVEGRARLEIVLVYPHQPLPDPDNCTARCKALIDGLKGPDGFFRDDSPEWLDLHVRAEVQKGRKATVLRLTEARS